MQLDPALMAPRDLYAWMIDLVVPRPIALVATVARDGTRNLAPFSFFTGIAAEPPLVGLSIARRRDRGSPSLGAALPVHKDTITNIRESGEFVINITSGAVVAQAVKSSGDYPPEVDEFELSGLTPLASSVVAAPRVAESPAAFECRLHGILPILESADFVIGRIERIHVRDDVLAPTGRVDPRRLDAVGRLGANRYARLGEILAFDRPLPLHGRQRP